jgi:hypothetical protein
MEFTDFYSVKVLRLKKDIKEAIDRLNLELTALEE